MTKRTVTIELASGLEARPIAMLVQLASSYESKIYVESDNKKVNAKSIMGIIAFNPSAGMTVTIAADGNDENDITFEKRELNSTLPVKDGGYKSRTDMARVRCVRKMN